MKRRAYIVGLLVVLLLSTTGRTVPVYGKVVSSAVQFHQYFRDLKQTNTMGPIERFVFSLVLANAKAPKANAVDSDAPLGRT
ncbi:MAG: hypothetical protein JWP63_162 [Candidatus Solibacter sp.]|nr:hypothetical protein [Candidatus Solibacter sp.]